jgi:hypothetical protein
MRLAIVAPVHARRQLQVRVQSVLRATHAKTIKNTAITAVSKAGRLSISIAATSESRGLRTEERALDNKYYKPASLGGARISLNGGRIHIHGGES